MEEIEIYLPNQIMLAIVIEIKTLHYQWTILQINNRTK